MWQFVHSIRNEFQFVSGVDIAVDSRCKYTDLMGPQRQFLTLGLDALAKFLNSLFALVVSPRI